MYGLCTVWVVILYCLREFGICVCQAKVPSLTPKHMRKNSMGILLLSVYKVPYIPHSLVVLPEVDQKGRLLVCLIFVMFYVCISLLQITDACSACFEQRTVFTQQVLAKALSQMVGTYLLYYVHLCIKYNS